MSTIDLAKRRVTAVIDEIKRLKESEFPYAQPREALNRLEQKLNNQLSVLGKISPDAPADIGNEACSESLYKLFLYVPYLGFILRSTNVRNAFETYFPLLRLAKSLVHSDTKLILSSEWEFSPFMYPPTNELPGFVLVGLPAPESSNPLLVPLAGHELGHSVWVTQGLSKELEGRIEERILCELSTSRKKEYEEVFQGISIDELQRTKTARTTWKLAYSWALLQTEEIFCDFVGLRLFAEAYLHAFSYLLSPGVGGQRIPKYPNIKHRVRHLTKAAEATGISVPPGFQSRFIEENEPSEKTARLLLSVADTVSESLVIDLIILAWEHADNRAVPDRNEALVDKISGYFKSWVIPTPGPYSLVDVLNAAWKCYQDDDLWNDSLQIKPEDRYRILADLVLKSMEVSEFHELLKNSHDLEG
ncbi:MAG: hypothetical protein ACOYXY_06965 [Thermodesulfobacteriota bacterium]